MKNNSLDLFDIYSYLPYENSKSHLDRIIKKENYVILFNEFSKIFSLINKELSDKFFKDDFFYSSKNLIILEPHLFSFNLLLKAITLDKIVDRHPNTKIILNLYKEELEFKSRFYNQYAYIASKIGDPFVINIKENYGLNYTNDPSAKNRILSLLNFTKQNIIYEFLRKIGVKRKKFYLGYGRNYIKREIEQELFFRGYSEISIDSIIKNYKSFNPNDLEVDEDFKYVQNLIGNVLFDFINKHINNLNVVKSFILIITELFIINIQELLENKSRLRNYIKLLSDKFEIEFALTNGLFHNTGKSIYDAMKFNNMKVYSAEHGLTNGISKDCIPNKYSNECNTSDFLFCYNDSSTDTHNENKTSRTIVIPVGAHSFSKRILNKKIFRLYYRKKFNLRNVCVFYVSHNIELNVGKYFPYTKPCSEIFEDEKQIISALSRVNKDIIYKEYPTKQFPANRNDFINEIISKHKNIKNIQTQEDFRYMRNVADIIVTQSSESTLEWCIGLNKPLVFLDSKYYEPLLDENVINAFKNCFFFFNYDKLGWENEFIKFLNKPYEEILNLWAVKQIYRNQYDQKYFLSKNKNAGKLGANYILQQIDD